MGLTRTTAAALAALTATLPAQALDQAARSGEAPRAPTCYTAAPPGPAEEGPPRLIPDLGTPTGLVPDTRNPQAARWFEQGMLLVWAYDEAEAIRAFRMAQSLDRDCALCHWGEALARSPTLNLQPPNVDLGAASTAAATAAALAARKAAGKLPGAQPLTPLAQGLVRAMSIRAPLGADAFDDEGYAQAMAALADAGLAARSRAKDLDPVLVLAADAEIVRWSAAGTPLQGAVRYLGEALKHDPDHTGAMHFLIHAAADITEQPRLASEAAGKLGKLAPGATHLIHMPAHVFYETGQFGRAVAENRRAIRAYEKFETYGPAVSGYRRYLLAHDHHYAIQAALIRGDRNAATGLVDSFRRHFPVQDPLFRIRPAHFAAPWFALGRLSPDEALDALRPELGFSDAARALNQAAWFYARGEAHASKGDAAAVDAQAAGIADLLAGPAGRALDPESEAIAKIARSVLEGRAAMLRRDWPVAASAYRSAMNAQFYSGLAFDPPPFWYGVRRSLAAAMYAAGDGDGAARQLDALARVWPGDPLADYLRSRILRDRGEAKQADEWLARAREEWGGTRDLATYPVALI